MTVMRAVLCCAALVAAPPALAAQDEPASPWKAQVDFGLVNTAGNTSTTTLSVSRHAHDGNHGDCQGDVTKDSRFDHCFNAP